MDLAVAPWARRRGVAARLLARVPAGRRRGRPARCCWRCGPRNAEALALYEKWGFATVGTRKRYYTDTGEDALVMMRPVGADCRARSETRRRRRQLGRGPLLAIESSCDDSAAAVLSPGGEVLSNVVALPGRHPRAVRRGGARGGQPGARGADERRGARGAAIRPACGVDDLGGVAVTVGPGLIGALLVGVQTAKAIAWARRLPLYPVNHLHGHLAAVWLADREAPLPMVTLVASGGHTVAGGRGRPDHATGCSGQTLDDAAGEAFDKGARLLGLGYPGGRELDELAEKGDPKAFDVPGGAQAVAAARLLLLGRQDGALLPAAGHDAPRSARRAPPTWPPPTGRRSSRPW